MNENYNDIHGTIKVTVEHPEHNKIRFVLDAKNSKKLAALSRDMIKEVRKNKVLPDISKIRKEIKAEGQEQARSIIAAYVDRYEADLNKFLKFGGDPEQNRQKLAYYDACLSAYFEDALASSRHAQKVSDRRDKAINKQEQKLFASQGIFDLPPEQLLIARDWLKDNVKGITFIFPYADDDEDLNTSKLNSERQDTLKAKWKNALDNFLGLFPDAVEGRDYKLRHPSAEDDPHKDLWHPTATVVFKTTLRNAPEPVLTAIENAKGIALRNGIDVKGMGATLDSKQLTSYYFVIGMLDLFFNDLRFYVKSEDWLQNNFTSGMNKIMKDYSGLDATADDYFNAFSDEDIQPDTATDTTAEV